MINIECPNCQKKYSLPPEKFQNRQKVKLKCNSCGNSFVFNASDQSNGEPDDLVSSGGGDATVVGMKFSKGNDTSAPFFFPKDCNIALTYKFKDKEYKVKLNKQVTVIGRTEGDIVINDPLMSRKHASIEVKNSTMVELRDLVSKNGTFHNDMKISSVFLRSGDTIRVGSINFLFSNQIKFI